MIEVVNAPRLAPLAHRVTGSDLSTVPGGATFGRRLAPEAWSPPEMEEQVEVDLGDVSIVAGAEEYLRKVDSDLFMLS